MITIKDIQGAASVDALLDIIAQLFREKVVSNWDDYVECQLDENEFRDFMSDMLTGSYMPRRSKLDEQYQEALASRCAELTDIEDPYDILEAYPDVLSDFDDWWSMCHEEIKEDNAQAETEAWLSQPWR